MITTFAGGGTSGLGDGGPAAAAVLANPCGLAIDASGNIFIADPGHQRVRKVDFSTGIITTVAGTGNAGYNGDGIPATSADLHTPGLIAIDAVGDLLISDGDNYRLRKVDHMTGIITTFAGSGTYGSIGEGIAATSAQIMGGNVACDALGNVYITDDYRIRKINTSGIITAIGGTGSAGVTLEGTQATATPIDWPQALCVDVLGNIYFSDASASVRKITTATGVLNRVAGTNDSVGGPYLGDGLPATASHIGPFGIWVDEIGRLFISDFGNHRIEKVDTNGLIYSIAGNDTSGFSGDGGNATEAKLSYPEDVLVDKCGNVFIADFNNERIRKISLHSPPGISILGTNSSSLGNNVTLIANSVYAGPSPLYKWSKNGVAFATTPSDTLAYTKTACIDSIVAIVYGCNDSALSAVHIVKCNASVENQTESECKFQLFPNPSRLELNIVTASEMETVAVINLLGQVVYFGVCNGAFKRVVDVRELPAGVYIVRVVLEDGGVGVERFVKNN